MMMQQLLSLLHIPVPETFDKPKGRQPVNKKRARRHMAQPEPNPRRSSRGKGASDREIDTVLARYPHIVTLTEVFEENGIEVMPRMPDDLLTGIRYKFRPVSAKKLGKMDSYVAPIAQRLKVNKDMIVIDDAYGGCIAVEVYNPNRKPIMFENMPKASDPAPLSLVFGLSDTGEVIEADIAKMPHLLVGGPTNTGKSTLINSILLQLMHKNTPEDLQLVIIDPKGLDFAEYGDDIAAVPHLITPVIDDMDAAPAMLRWAVDLMQKRYKLMQRKRVRGIDAYNEKLTKEELVNGLKLPRVVILIDEMADIMLTHGKDIVTSVKRLGQKARAAGIHLILATQRPNKESIPMDIRSQFTNGGASFKTPDAVGSTSVLGEGNTGAKFLPPVGVILLNYGGSIRRAIVPMISDNALSASLSGLLDEPNYRLDLDEDISTGDVSESRVASLNEDDKLYLQAIAICRANKDNGISRKIIGEGLGLKGSEEIDAIIKRLYEDGKVGEPKTAPYSRRKVLLD